MKKLLIALLFVSPSVMANPVNCMAKAIYFESRGGSRLDMMAVGHTVQNRVNSDKYPNSVCSVVRQPNQFSPNIRRGSPIRERGEWQKSLNYARQIINGQSRDFTNGATHFHTHAIRPYWSRKFRRVYNNSQHIFYRW